jgi:hypothetical protein
MAHKDVEEAFGHILSGVRFVPEERIAALLREAGFGEPERFFGALLLGGWVARKA